MHKNTKKPKKNEPKTNTKAKVALLASSVFTL